MDVSIIIVNFNTRDLLKNCIESIYKYTNAVSFEIIVSDNGSKDGSVEMIKKDFPEVILLENNANLGFGKANNKGLDIAKGKYIFYLNSDTVLLNDACKIFFDFWENSPEKDSIGALGANLLDDDMNIIHSGGQFPSKKSLLKELGFMFCLNIFLSILYIFRIDGGRFRKLKKSEEHKTGKLDFITGADLFMKNNDFARFDENFFLYYEDTDLQFNTNKNGLSSILIDGPEIKHLCGGSVGEAFNIKRKGSYSRIQFELSRVLFSKKNLGSKPFVFALKMIISLIWINPFLFGNTKKFYKKLWKI